MFSFLSALISPVTNIASKMIMDKDKYAELQFKKVELTADAKNKLLEKTTTPNVDAAVKLMIAFRDILLPMMRPVGSLAMAAFAAYAAKNGIDLPVELQSMLYGAFPAWGLGRQFDKGAKNKIDAIKAQFEG